MNADFFIRVNPVNYLLMLCYATGCTFPNEFKFINLKFEFQRNKQYMNH